jgi:phosphoribosylformimino-5-aminoimidazole carboxamide ribotide isomerase
MLILPAIDLLNGKCVRLVQGRYDRVIDYERDPLDVANSFFAQGAQWLHVIDLDGARDGQIRNHEAVRRLAGTGAKVQFGGGVRDEDAIRAALDAGAARVIIGTRALEDWAWFERIAHRPEFDQRIALGLDARLGKLAVQGWTRQTERTACEVAASVAGWPLAAIIYTDIGRAGVLLGPNMQAIATLAASSPVPVVAAGGVSDIEDVRRLAQLNLSAIVIGRAIYEGALDLPTALQVGHAPLG